jgi:Cu(I)/Ag(I) efflux system membrane protein CusA/SilA
LVIHSVTALAATLGTETVTTTVEGRACWGVSVRYLATCSNPQMIAREILVPLPNGASIPHGPAATASLLQGPASVRTESAQLAAFCPSSISGA